MAVIRVSEEVFTELKKRAQKQLLNDADNVFRINADTIMRQVLGLPPKVSRQVGILGTKQGTEGQYYEYRCDKHGTFFNTRISLSVQRGKRGMVRCPRGKCYIEPRIIRPVPSTLAS